MSAMSKHMPERVGTLGRRAHMQWLGTSLQPAQRVPLGPPLAKKGLALRARRAERRRATAWGMVPTAYDVLCFAFSASTRSISFCSAACDMGLET